MTFQIPPPRTFVGELTRIEFRLLNIPYILERKEFDSKIGPLTMAVKNYGPDGMREIRGLRRLRSKIFQHMAKGAE